MKKDSYESNIRFNDKWNCFFSLLQFQVNWCNQNNDNLKTRQNKKCWKIVRWSDAMIKVEMMRWVDEKANRETIREISLFEKN
jgi:hypothetical protein